MTEPKQGLSNEALGRLTSHPEEHDEDSFKITEPPYPDSIPSARALKLVEQLREKTEQGKLIWTTGVEDGQFKTLLARGELAFVVQAMGDVRRFLMLDDRQEVILE